MTSTNPLTAILNDLNYDKADLMRSPERDSVLSAYNPYVIDLIYSNDLGTVLIANEANQAKITDKQMHHDFYLHALPRKKRFIPFAKAQKFEDLEAVSKLYKVNRQVAKSYLRLFSEEQIEEIRKKAEFL